MSDVDIDGPPLERLPVLGLHDRIVITRAEHGGFVASIGEQGTCAAFSTMLDLQGWLDQMFKRWRPITEHQSARPRPDEIDGARR